MDHYSVGALVFPGFELLDLFGPLEMFGMHAEAFDIQIVAQSIFAVASAQGPRSLPDQDIEADRQYDVLLVPGGQGTRSEVHNPEILNWLRNQANGATLVTSVCTGSALLARAGVLDERRATTNKRAFQWVADQGPRVEWISQARWVRDGRFYTASGVSAGIDMSLAVIAELLGEDAARDAADWGEYFWNSDSENDPFAIKAGLVRQ